MAQPANSPRPPRRATSTLLARLAWCNLAVVLLVWFGLAVVSERHWITGVLVYLPRSAWGLGAVVLLPLAAWRDRRSLPVNLAALLVVGWPVMGLVGVERLLSPRAAPAGAPGMRIVSCNVQSYRPNFAAVLAEIERFRPDLVALQEAFRDDHRLEELYPDWHVLRRGEYLVASRWGLRELELFRSPISDRDAALACDVEHPGGRFRLFVVHPISARHGLARLTSAAIYSDRQAERQARFSKARELEGLALRAFVERLRGDLPILVAGDFNMPSDSSLYETCFGDLQNAFDLAGIGYGYTAPCGGPGPWPEGLPWLRVDHVLAGPGFFVQGAWTGQTNGSDHRLVAAVVSMQAPRPARGAAAQPSLSRSAAFSSSSAGGSFSPMPRR